MPMKANCLYAENIFHEKLSLDNASIMAKALIFAFIVDKAKLCKLNMS